MSISAIFTSIGTFLTSPIVTGAANVASIATLPVSIATKVDTKKMRKSISSIRSDINLMSSDVLDLTQQVIDMRSENRYNVAYSGQIPVIVNKGSNPQFATAFRPLAASMAAQKQNMYAALINGQTPQPDAPAQPQQNQPIQQETPVQVAPQIQQPVAPPAQAAPVQNVMVGGHDMSEMLKNMLPDIISGVVAALNQQPTPAQPETPQPPAQPAPDQKDDKKQNKNG